MRLGAAAGVVVVALLAGGCGGARPSARTTTAATTRTAAAGLRVGVVGPLTLDVQGVQAVPRTLSNVGDLALVLVSSEVADAATVAEAARAHPAGHFALVGASTKGNRAPNLVGLVLPEDQAALLAGLAAGLAAADQGGSTPEVAWIGPEERRLAAAFGRGVHQARPDAAVLHQWSRAIPARCKEAALTALDRGATIVMAHGGICAEAAAAAAHEQNLPALRLGDFEVPGVAAALVAHDALAGIYHGGEDLVFGAGSGAVGIRHLDPRIPLATAARARTAAQELANGVAPAG